MRYPGNYGFIPHTLSEDGDPCRRHRVQTRAEIAPGAVINCRPVGVLMMEDESGGDEKIIAVVPMPKLTKRYEKVHEYTDLPEITLQQIGHFSSTTRTWRSRSGSRCSAGRRRQGQGADPGSDRAR